MIKLLLWLSYGEIMEVGEGRNTTGFHDAYLSFWWASQLLFFFNGCLYYDTFFEVLKKSLKGEKSLPKCLKYKDR